VYSDRVSRSTNFMPSLSEVGDISVAPLPRCLISTPGQYFTISSEKSSDSLLERVSYFVLFSYDNIVLELTCRIMSQQDY